MPARHHELFDLIDSDDTPYDNLAHHRFADWFPEMPPDEFEEFVDDIRIHGVKEPITLYEGKILDGRHRHKARLITGKHARYHELPNGIDPIDFVLSRNIHRRHLTTSQRAFIAEQVATHKSVGRPGKDTPNVTRRTAAKLTGASPRQISRVRAVQERCPPEITNAVRDGAISVNDAEATSKLPPQKQIDALNKVIQGETKSMRAAIDLIDDPTHPQERERDPATDTATSPRHDDQDDTPATATVPTIADAETVRNVLETIELDPASSAHANAVVKATRSFAPGDETLDWHGKTWLRLPESDHAMCEQLLSQCINAIETGTIGAAVVDLGPSHIHGTAAQEALTIAHRVLMSNDAPRIRLLMGDPGRADAFDRIYSHHGVILAVHDAKH